MKRNSIYIGVIAFFLLIAMIAGGICLRQYLDAKASVDTFSELENLIEQPADLVDLDETTSDKEVDPESTEATAPELTEAQMLHRKYLALYEENEDFVGWISIGDTNVNYPVMQTIDSPDFYLKHGFDKTYSNYGVPYVDEACAVGLSDNIVIYGHNMKNGSMFHDLLQYADADFWANHQTIHFDTMSRTSEYQVILAFRFDTKHETFRYNEYTDMNEEEFAEFMDECRRRQLYDTGVPTAYGDELITLSTCEYTYENGRFAVVAKRITD